MQQAVCGPQSCPWTLTRCGHHPFLDDRVARHGNLDHPCLCGSSDWSLIHALRTCPLFEHWRRTWLQRLQCRCCDSDLLSDDSLLQFIFATHGMGNTSSSTHAPGSSLLAFAKRNDLCLRAQASDVVVVCTFLVAYMCFRCFPAA